uniref:Uncharacterized protein n=1 Tax=Cacopsylla melanoneura TaxID=428564 RepID=A0A8D8WH43_9HEMI
MILKNLTLQYTCRKVWHMYCGWRQIGLTQDRWGNRYVHQGLEVRVFLVISRTFVRSPAPIFFCLLVVQFGHSFLLQLSSPVQPRHSSNHQIQRLLFSRLL